MKTLTNLAIAGLKSLAGRMEMQVPRLLALTGPNGSGKTSILQGIRIGVVGHDPDMGKTLGATRQLASGDGEIQVGMTFDDGFGLRRTCGRSMETVVAPPQGERVEKEMQARIEEETGAFVFSFDLKAWLTLSHEKRRAMAFGLLPRELAQLDQELWKTYLGYSAAADPVKSAIDKLWLEHVLANESIVDGLASALDFARAKANEAERDRLTQVKISAAADLEAETESTALPESVEDMEALQARLSVTEQQIGELVEQQRAAKLAADRRRDHVVRLEEMRRRVADAETRIQTLEAEAASQVQPDQGLVEDATTKLRAAEATLREQTSALQELRAARGALHSELAALKGRLQGLDGHLQELIGADRCPTCGAEAELEAHRGRLRAERKALQDEADQLPEELTKKDGEVSRLDQAVGDAAALVKRGQELFESIRAKAEQSGAGASALERQREQLAWARGELARMEQVSIEDPQVVDPERLRSLETEAAGIRIEIRAEHERAKAVGKAEAARERADRQRHELDRRSARAEALKDLQSALQKLRAHVIHQMVVPIEVTANELLQEIDAAKTFRFLFEREGKDILDFGFEEAGVFRSYDSASTGEDAFLAVVLVAALITAVQPAWRVLMVDNAESIDDERRRWLMEALNKLQDRLDNVILAGCCEFEPVEGWEIVDVRDLAGAAAVPA